jgi:hypothetical protein
MLTPASNVVWQVGGTVLARLLYRTRLMGPEALAAACTWGIIIALLPRRWAPIASVSGAVLLILAAVPSLYVELQPRWAGYGFAAQLADVRQVETQTGLYGLTAFGEFTPVWQSEEQQARLAEDIGPIFDAAAAPLRHPDAGTQVRTGHVTS